jgi:hypothetical protein
MSTNTTEQFILSFYYTSFIKRLFIIFGSICFLWLIIGCMFLSIQTYRHFKKRTDKSHHRSLQLPSLLIEETLKKNSISDTDQDDDNNDQTSVVTSVSFISERSKVIYEQTKFVPSYQRIPEEQFELILPTTAGALNMAYSQSTLSSSSDIAPSFLYYPAYRNFAYSHSILSSLADDFHQNTPRVSRNNSLSSTRQLNLKRQPSTTTTISQKTNATYLSSISSMKAIRLPIVMITDCDRSQTDIIELENFEPEKEWHYTPSQLRYLLNDRMPQGL